MSYNYSISRQVFNRYSTKEEETYLWLHQHLNEIIKSGSLSGLDTLKILSVGPGSGNYDAVILDELLKLQVCLHYTAVEPDRDQINEFRRTVAENPAYSQVKFVLHETTAQEFWGSETCTEKYDIIFFVHTLYFLTPLQPTLISANNILTPGGIIMSVTASGLGGWNFVIETYKGILPSAGRVTVEVIDEIVDDLELPVIREYLQYTLDTGIIFEAGEDGNRLLDFITHVNNFRQVSPPPLVGNLLQELKKCSYQSHGRILSNAKLGVHVIKKKVHIK